MTHGKASAGTLQIGIPACDELAWLPRTLADLANQTDMDFEVWVCLNQPSDWDADGSGREAALGNQATHAVLRRLRKQQPFNLHILDATSPQLAPGPDEAGVGWARRQLFETIFQARGVNAAGVSLDADTRVAPGYVAGLRNAFASYPNAVACALPYHHPLPEKTAQARQLLRYEIYLRYFHLNLWRIGSPYALTALGSALAFRGRAYQGAGGFSTRQAGEDFYLLQKLRKAGPVVAWVPDPVMPASRQSKRVPFGTGPLMVEGALPVIETRFPFYKVAHFDLIGQTYRAWEAWYDRPHRVPIQAFLDEAMGGDAPFERMRRNAASPGAFLRACHTRFDGLRILQCLRFFRERDRAHSSGLAQISELLGLLGESESEGVAEGARIGPLNQLRERLWACEDRFRKTFMDQWDTARTW